MKRFSNIDKVYIIRLISLKSILEDGIQERNLYYFKTDFDEEKKLFFDCYRLAIHSRYLKEIRIYEGDLTSNQSVDDLSNFIFFSKREAEEFLFDLSLKLKKLSNINNDLMNF